MPHRYVPPDFVPFELAHEPTERETTRWFCDVQGLLDQPADEIVLGWSGGTESGAEAVVLCATSTVAAYTAEGERRGRAMQLLWAGSDLIVHDRPATPEEYSDAVDAVVTDAGRWVPLPTDVDGNVTISEVTTADGGWAADVVLGDGTVLLVAGAGAAPSELALRRVDSWDSYGIDLSRSRPMSEFGAYRAARPHLE